MLAPAKDVRFLVVFASLIFSHFPGAVSFEHDF